MTLEEIPQKLDEVDITENQRARIKFQNKECVWAILAWKAHLVRSVAQEEAKQDALVQLDQEICLIIIEISSPALSGTDTRVFRQTR